MNNALYEIASFMVMRESIVWRWSHTRHHSDTIIVGRDPEIAVPRPPDMKGILMSFFNLLVYPKYFRQLVLHSSGRMSADEKTYIPGSEFPKICFRARVSLAIYLGVIALAIDSHGILPLLFIGLPNIFGSWLMVVYGLTQHAGLAENVLDHPPQLPDDPYEFCPPVSLLEYELSYGAPHVPRSCLIMRCRNCTLS